MLIDNIDIPDELCDLLIERAKSRYDHITPCVKKSSLHECFMVFKNSLYLYFNSPDHSTRAVKCDLYTGVIS